MSFLQKTPNINSFTELNEYLEDLEQRIADAFKVGEFDFINLNTLHAAPNNPREGDLINADGSDYDPGSGAGIYLYSTSYQKVGP